MASSKISAGKMFRQALEQEKPLQIVGTINANHALLAQRAGFKAVYLSGGGVAAGSLGMPDLGINTLEDVLIDVRRITAVAEVPLLVDIDTGFGPSALNISRTIKSLIRAGAGACHMEDQVGVKRCGHRPNKELVTTQEMCDRLKAATEARGDDEFYIIARTDAIAVEDVDRAIERSLAYQQAGADAIFVEAALDLTTYQQFKAVLNIPILANMTEFGKTPLYNLAQLAEVGVDMVLYPLSAFRASNKAAENTYAAIRRDGDQKAIVEQMQTRQELYESINYYHYEQLIDSSSGGNK